MTIEQLIDAANRDATSAALIDVDSGAANYDSAHRWYERLHGFIADFHSAPHTKLRDRSYLTKLWDHNPVAAIGNGTVKVAAALDSEDFVSWFADHFERSLPADSAEIEAVLVDFYDEIKARMGRLCTRIPHLKINRVLAVLYPEFFTTVADVGSVKYLHAKMGGSKKDHPVHAHLAIRRKVDAVLGNIPPAVSIMAARRMCLPWLLFDRITNSKVDESAVPDLNEQLNLMPQPAALRRKGLTAIKGSFATLLSFLPALDEGLTRPEFIDLISQASPNLAKTSVGMVINVVAREFDLCTREADVYRLSARGITLLDSRDANDLSDHLLTKVLGIDHVVRELSFGPRSKLALVQLLQKANPGWTTDFAPNAQLGWLLSLGVLTRTSSQGYDLAELGVRWAELITWVPEFLPSTIETPPQQDAESIGAVQLPAWMEISSSLKNSSRSHLSFDESMVRQLHAGLWSHPNRHFAVLTGISGSGKTQLALNYALTLCGPQIPGKESVAIIPVQPGWFESSPLMGYQSPIQDDEYRTTPFLDLMLRAVQDPLRPYLLILDEMNLSHPEQYLAPILSAMETQGLIEIHTLPDGTTELPRSFRYPSNLAIIGTVNMDETTHGISDKVLDRAFTLEFWKIDVAAFPGWQQSGLKTEVLVEAQRLLTEFGTALSPARLHFGWRTINDILKYLEFTIPLGMSHIQALDEAIYAKILPKLRGENSARLEAAFGMAIEISKSSSLTRCLEKLISMHTDLGESGTTRFWR